jgi:uncharacterized protein YjiS (DUF1127 family)
MTTAAYEAQAVWADGSIAARLNGRISGLAESIRRRQARREALRRLSIVDARTLDDLGMNRMDVNAILCGARRSLSGRA